MLPGLLLIFVITITLSIIWMVIVIRDGEYPNINSSTECNKAGDCDLDTGKGCVPNATCGNWSEDINKCIKGKVEVDSTGKYCVADTNMTGPIFALVIAFVSLVGIIITSTLILNSPSMMSTEQPIVADLVSYQPEIPYMVRSS